MPANSEFNGLTGAELVSLWLADIERMLRADPLLRDHLVYSTGRCEVTVKCQFAPSEPTHLEKAVASQVGNLEGATLSAQASEAWSFGDSQEGAPDRLREAADLPVPTLEKVAQGLVDVPRRKDGKFAPKQRPLPAVAGEGSLKPA